MIVAAVMSRQVRANHYLPFPPSFRIPTPAHRRICAAATPSDGAVQPALYEPRPHLHSLAEEVHDVLHALMGHRVVSKPVERAHCPMARSADDHCAVIRLGQRRSEQRHVFGRWKLPCLVAPE